MDTARILIFNTLSLTHSNRLMRLIKQKAVLQPVYMAVRLTACYLPSERSLPRDTAMGVHIMIWASTPCAYLCPCTAPTATVC